MLEVKKLKKKFGSNVVLNDISFNVSKGDIISIVGPSGSGKSTLLRCLNLIEKPSSGDIIFEGISLIGKKADFGTIFWLMMLGGSLRDGRTGRSLTGILPGRFCCGRMAAINLDSFLEAKKIHNCQKLFTRVFCIYIDTLKQKEFVKQLRSKLHRIRYN